MISEQKGKINSRISSTWSWSHYSYLNVQEYDGNEWIWKNRSNINNNNTFCTFFSYINIIFVYFTTISHFIWINESIIFVFSLNNFNFIERLNELMTMIRKMYSHHSRKINKEELSLTKTKWRKNTIDLIFNIANNSSTKSN